VNRRVIVGPLSLFFGNVNTAMGLRGHHHTAQLHLVYGHRQGDHGYPSFLATNNELRARLESLTGPRNTFRDATNEDVAERLFAAFERFTGHTWSQYGGRYWLHALWLDVEGTQDDIGHDNGTTRYVIERPHGEEGFILPAAIDEYGTGTTLPSAREQEIDRNARAYGWSVGRGHPLAEQIEDVDPENPFLDPNWRDKIPAAQED
jgi:hypothetical protein